MKRLCYLLVLVLLLAGLLIACSKADNSGIDEFEQILQSMNDPTKKEEKEEPFAQKVYVIIPEKASGELSAKANELAQKIYEKTQVEAVVKYDNEQIVVGGKTLEILVGYTKSIISRDAMKSLRVEDYICKWDMGSIVLGGRYDAATIKAVDEFIEKVLHSATELSLMNENVKIEHKIPYEISNVELNGYDLYDYTLVYTDGENGEREKTEILRDYIAKKSGYLLNVVEKKNYNSSVGKAIWLYCDLTAAEAFMRPEDYGVSLFAPDAYSLSGVIARFADMLLTAENGSAELEIFTKISFAYDSQALSICSITTESLGTVSLSALTKILESVRNNSYDIISFYDLSPELETYIKANVLDGYKYTAVEKEDGGRVAIISREANCKNLTLELYEGFAFASFNVNGEEEERRLIALFAPLTDSIETEIFEKSENRALLVVYGGFIGDVEGFDFVTTEKQEFNGQSVNQTVFATPSYSLSDFQKDIDSHDNSISIFLSFSLSVNISERFENLKNSLK